MPARQAAPGYKTGGSPKIDRELAKKLAASLPILSAADLAVPVPKMEWLIHGLWPLGSHGPIAGRKKTIKSYTTLAMAIAVASGEDAFGNPDWYVPRRRAVVIYAGEGGERLIRSRLQRIARDMYGIDDISTLRMVVLPGHAQFDTGAFTGYLFRAIDDYLDGRPPGLVIVDSVYNYHPSGQDVQVSNVYDRGPMFSRQSDLIYRECGQRSVLWLVDHFKATGNGQLDLDSISQTGMAEFADTWWLQGHRSGMKPDPDKGKFYLNVEVGSRQDWPGTALELDWDIGTYSKELGEYIGELSVSHRSSERHVPTVPGKTGNSDISDFIVAHVDLHDMEITKTKVCRATREKFGIGNDKFYPLWDELVDESKLVSGGKRAVDEGGVKKQREVWGINRKQSVSGNQSSQPVRNRSRTSRRDYSEADPGPDKGTGPDRDPRRGRGVV